MLTITDWLWKDEFWFPPGLTWEDMKDTEETCYPHPRHLLLCIPLTALLLILQYVFKRSIALPLSRKMGLKGKMQKKVPLNAMRQAYYRRHKKKPEERELNGLAKHSDLQPWQVKRWLQSCLKQDQMNLTDKFCESSWIATYNITSSIVGLAVFYDKTWFWDDRECWTGYPQQPLLPSVFAYYMLQLSFYCSVSITLSYYTRKDFKQQLVHHAATVFLICYSYCANYLRIGIQVMVILDISTVFLDFTKIFIYAKWQWTSEVFFILFAVSFLFFRLVIFPYKVLYNAYYYSIEFYPPFFGYYFMNALLMVLYLLNIYWSCLIIQMARKFLESGMIKEDVRSDTEDCESDKEETEKKKSKY